MAIHAPFKLYYKEIQKDMSNKIIIIKMIESLQLLLVVIYCYVKCYN